MNAPPKTGKLTLNFFSWAVDPENPILTVSGYNILPENEYEIEIKNDFTTVRKVKLIRKGYNALTANLSTDLSPGNNHARILINSQEYKRTGGRYDPFYANLNKQASRSQQVIVHLSQPSLFVAVDDCDYYRQTTEISRMQEIVSNIWFTDEEEGTQVRLKLVNQERKKEYLLTTATQRFSGMCNTRTMNKFKITDDVTNGTYKVYAVVGSTELRISEPMAQFVKIK